MDDSTIWFTSDLHLGQESIIDKRHRPFLDVDEMNEKLITNFNRFVTPVDLVFILGDLTNKVSKKKANELISRLNGKKILIRGNHDKSYDKSLFVDIRDYYEIKFNGILWCMSHYPMWAWNKEYKGSIQVHGHIHSTSAYNQQNQLQGVRQYDAGVDANDYKPVNIETIYHFFY